MTASLTGPTTADMLAQLRAGGSNPLLLAFPQGAVFAFDHDLRYVAVSGAGLVGTGLTRARVEGKTLAEVLPAGMLAEAEPLFREALAGRGSTADFRYHGLTYQQQLTPIRGPDGVVIAALGFTQDVTEQREAVLALEQRERELADQQRRLRQAYAIGQAGSWEFDLQTRKMSWSDELFELFGVDRSQFDGDYRQAAGCIHPGDWDRVEAMTVRSIETGEPLAVRFRVIRPSDGALRWFAVRGQVLVEAGIPARLAGAAVDLTDQVQAEESARAASEFFDAVLTASPDYTFINDLATNRPVYGSRHQDVLGLNGDQVLALGAGAFDSLVHPADRAGMLASNLAAGQLVDGAVLTTRYRGRHTDGSWRWLSRRVTPFKRDASGAVVEILGVVRDITGTMEAEERREHTALHDPLTDLPNRALLIDRLEAALIRSNRQGHEIVVLCCDLDNFKRVNDSCGHAGGDAVLQETARRLTSILREGDTVARVGGDEFVLIVEPWNRGAMDTGLELMVPGIEPNQALALQFAERVADVLREPFTVNGIELVVTASTGIAYAHAPVDGGIGMVSADEVLQDANAAMYLAKARGKDGFEVFQDSLRTDLTERGRIEQVLRRAVRQPVGAAAAGQEPTLAAAYQPVFDAGSGALVGFEALARLTDTQGRAIAPDVFIAVAEGSGIIGPLGRVMLDLACGQLAAWRATLPGMNNVTMAVNVSALQAQHARLVDDVHQALAAYGLAPGDLVLELTETALMQAPESTITTLRALHDEGICIAIDDFGTGYASLRYLATLPVSTLKVDRSFTAGLPDDVPSRKIVNAVAGLAADLGMTCIIEGVETVAQRAALPAGVQLQGWLTGRPESANALDLTDLLSRGAPAGD